MSLEMYMNFINFDIALDYKYTLQTNNEAIIIHDCLQCPVNEQ